MVLTEDRTALDRSLRAQESICILRGEEQSVPGRVHSCLERDWGPQPWHKWFLVTDESLLTTAEISAWFNDNPFNDYAFLGRKTRAVTSNGSSSNDLLSNGNCDFLTYIEKFAEADE